MAKKRKGGSRPQEASGPNLDVGESRKRIRTYEDVADSDDEFHDSRDKILLDEGPEAKRRRKWNEQEEFLQPSDEEVLGYSEPEEDEEEHVEDGRQSRSGRSANKAAASESDGSGDEDEADEELGWGTTKADLYGADAIETEEQALEEEAEALRLQKKQLQAMSAVDYGFDEADWQDAEKDAGKGDEVVTEVLPELQIAEDMDEAQRRKLLKSRYPEFEPLSQELVKMQALAAGLREELVGGGSNTTTKFRAASAYLGVLTMYFALLASTASEGDKGVTALSATTLRDHPVMDSLIECRTLWQKAEQLPADEDVDDSGLGSSDDAAEGADVDELIEEAPSKKPHELSKPTTKLSRAQRHAAAAQAAADARRADRLKRTEADLADLDTLLAASSRPKTKERKAAAARDDDSDVGEEAPLSAHEAAEKARRKKSLRFYTSQIAQKANKRGATGRNAGGDEDIPHRERLKDRQARLNAEAEKRGRSKGDGKTDLGGDSEDEDAQQAQQIRAEADDDNEYYDMVASRTAKRKADKAALAELQKQAELQGGRVVEEATVGADGKRKISYAIEKNKGLTPHRKKDVRNPRVKKRKKFEEKKKKLASMKPVYKGGEGRGGYGGELTGIKKGLVRSTKL